MVTRTSKLARSAISSYNIPILVNVIRLMQPCKLSCRHWILCTRLWIY